MTKMIKMSLMAAVAVAGTTASAQSLEDAIKNVDVSGYVDYRLENKSVEQLDNKSFNVNEYAVNVTATSKVNDIVKATVSVGFDEALTDNGSNGGTAGQDADPSMNVSNAYFTFNLGGTTVMAGKQAIPSAFVDKVDTAKTGTGIVALHKVNDALTLAGAHFMNNNIKKVYGGVDVVGADVAAKDTKTTELIAMGKVEMVNYAVHYNMTDLSKATSAPIPNLGATDAKHLFVKVGAAVAGVNLELKHATASADSSLPTIKWADSSVTQLKASTKVSNVTLSGAYAMADKKMGDNDTLSTDVALDGDNDADVHLKVWQLSTNNILNKGNVMMLSAAMPVMDNLTASLTYASATDDAYDATEKDTDFTEILAQLTYKMSKNFTLHGRYSTMNKDTNVANGSTDSDYSRIQVRYTF